MRILLLFLLLTCCSSPRAPEPQRLKISFNAMPVTVDPRKSSDFISSTLICMIFEGLTRCRADGSPEMALADHVEISSDRLTYLFHLRSSVWSDGTPVTAHDFEKSWKTILDPAHANPSAYLFYPIKHAEASYKGLVSSDQIGIRAVNDSILEVVLERPTGYFLSLTAYPSYLPAPSHALDRIGRWTSGEQVPLISNGPFCLHSACSKSHILLRKNERFWNLDPIHLDEIHISIVPNETTALQMFARGELDWLGGAISPLPIDALQTIQDSPSLQFSPMAATTFCAFKTDHPHLSNQHLRQALSLAMNRSDIVEKITQMRETPATRFIPPSLSSNRNRLLYQPHDPELAKLHLQKALSELEIEPKEIHLTLSFRSTQLDARIAQILQTQWKETLGLTIALEQKEPQNFKELLYHRKFDLALAFWIAQFSDPINILERFENSENWKNYPGWNNEQFTKLVRSAWSQTDQLKRFSLIDEAEDLLAEEMPLAPIYHWSNMSLCNPRLQNIQMTPNGAVLFEYCYWE